MIDTFPRNSELFIQREIDELRRRGVEIQVFSICRPPHPNPTVTYLETDICASREGPRPRGPRLFSSLRLPPLLKLRRTNRSAGPPTLPTARCAAILAPLLDNHPRLLAARLLRSPSIAELARQISAGGFDIIHAHFLGVASTFALIASKITGVPLTISAHAADIFCCGEAIHAKARHARVIFTCCKENVKELIRIGIPRHRVRLSYHGLPDNSGVKSERKNRPGDVISILAFGRFVEKKGFGYLIDAARDLRIRGLRFKCTICGDGPLRRRLTERARLAGLVECVEFPGWVTQKGVQDLLAASDILVCPGVTARDGDRDGVPNVILEAMAAGVPVVASDAGGIPEAVLNETTGIIVPQRDHTALADAIIRLADDPHLQRSLVEGARKHLKDRFNLTRNIAPFLDVWG